MADGVWGWPARVLPSALARDRLGGSAAQNALTAAIVGLIEASQQDVQIGMAVDGDASTSRCTRPLKRSTMPLVRGV
jgi:hypothetical protein